MHLFSTSGHLFLIRLISQAAPGVLAVQFELPLLQMITGTRQPETAPEAGPKIDLARLHTQYTIALQGKQPVAWMPVEAYDDGRLTVIRFAESLEFTAAPVLMAVTPDGKKTLPLEYITYQVPGRKDQGEFYLTKGLYPRLRLIDATKGTVDIVRLPTPAPAYVEQPHVPR
jgi:type IV secretory pathway VirB9-like protein